MAAGQRILKGVFMSIRVLFICHGNICRSTMAESVMTYLVKQAGLEKEFYINSAATSREEIGNLPHYGTVSRLKQAGIPVVPHRAIQMTAKDYDDYDYLIGMDSENIRNMNRIAGGDPQGKIYKLLSFADYSDLSNVEHKNNNEPLHTFPNNKSPISNNKPLKVRDVADPWYTGNFDATFDDVYAGCKGMLEFLGFNGHLN